MRTYQATPKGLVPGLPVSAGEYEHNNFVRLGTKFVRSSRPLNKPLVRATMDYGTRANVDGDRVMSCDVLLGDKIELVSTTTLSGKGSVLVSFFVDSGTVEFVAGPSCEVLVECEDVEHNTNRKGATALVKLSTEGSLQVLVRPKQKLLQFSTPEARTAATLTYKDGEPYFDIVDPAR